MKHLVVLGLNNPTIPESSLGTCERIKNRLHERWADYVHFPVSREQALALVNELDDVVMGYAPLAFASAITAASHNSANAVYVHTDEPQILVTCGLQHPSHWLMTDDPRQFLEPAMHALRTFQALDVDSDIALDVLSGILTGTKEAAF